MLPPDSTTPIGSDNPYQIAYDVTAAEREILPSTDLITVNVDIAAAVATVLGVISRLGAFEGEIALKLPGIDVDSFERTELYAEALAHAHALYLGASPPAEPLPELAEQAIRHRDLLLANAKALAMHGLFDGRPLGDLKRGSGYLNIATDLNILANMFRERWSDVAHKTALDANDIAEAEKLSNLITRAYGDRTQQPPHLAQPSMERQRAFTLLVKSYDQIRKIVTYIRWESGDADKIAPSIWANRGSATKSNAANKTETPALDNSPLPSLQTQPGAPSIAPSVAPPPAGIGPGGQPDTTPLAGS